MNPTHRHADGGLYEYVEPCPIKDPNGDEWLKGVAYRGEDDVLRATTLTRWEERFEPLSCDELQIKQTASVAVFDGEEIVASFVFHTRDIGDVRHMLVTAGPQKSSVTAPEIVAQVKRVLQSQAEMISLGLHVRDHDFPDLIGDVHAFHAKFKQEYMGKPRMLPEDLHRFRIKFHDEETHEYRDEYVNLVDAVMRKDRRDIINVLELQLDALCDAAWVILGTADLQFGRRAFIEAWRRVVKANMAKVLATDDPNAQDSGREVKYDIRKPAGWQAPDHRDLVSDNAIFDELFGIPEAEAEFQGHNQEVQA